MSHRQGWESEDVARCRIGTEINADPEQLKRVINNIISNSVKYIEHVLDLWNLDWYRNHQIKRFEIAYVAEAHAGDSLSFYQEQTGDDEYCIRIVRTDGTECCRSKVVFLP